MRNYTKSPLLAAAIASLVLPASIGMAGPIPGALIYTVILPPGEFGSIAYTSVVVGGLAAVREFCAELKDTAYRVDCLAERFGALAKSIPKNSDYDEVQKALKSASDQLAELARNNRDRSLPRGRATRPGSSQTTSRPLTPVSSAAAAQVNQQAQVILAETQTLLLRSAEGSQSKISQYAQIADAIGSNKVLLRAT